MSVPALPAEPRGLGEVGQGRLPHQTPTLLLEASLPYVEKLPELPVSPWLTPLGGTWCVETNPPTNQRGHGPLQPLRRVVAEHRRVCDPECSSCPSSHPDASVLWSGL